MSLTDGDKAICAEITREIVHTVVTEVMTVHLDTCPHGKMIVKSKALLVGACIGGGLTGGGVVYGLIQAITAI